MFARQYVYFMQCDFGGPIKIGCSHKPTLRQQVARPEMPFELVLIGQVPGSYYIEDFLHCWFRPWNIRGEWFQPHPELWRTALEARTKGAIHFLPPDIPRGMRAELHSSDWLRSHFKVPVEEIAGLMGCSVRNVEGIEAQPTTTNHLYLAALSVALTRRGHGVDLRERMARRIAPCASPEAA